VRGLFILSLGVGGGCGRVRSMAEDKPNTYDKRIEYILLAAATSFVLASIVSGNYIVPSTIFFAWSVGFTLLRLWDRKRNEGEEQYYRYAPLYFAVTFLIFILVFIKISIHHKLSQKPTYHGALKIHHREYTPLQFWHKK